MTVPLDRLYQFINNQAEQIHGDTVELRRFHPHGSKNIDDLSPIRLIPGYQRFISPLIFCYDQEPLDFDRYTDVEPSWVPNKHKQLVKKYQLEKFNLQFQRHNIYDKSILIHSEQRSTNLQKYCDNWFIPVYYWSHAIIGLDWFRFAQHVCQKKQSQRTFLIYNRAWSGTREYRLRFAELLVSQNLQDNCQTTINPTEPDLGIHYHLHKFKNSKWRPCTELENFFPTSTAHSHYSADFDIEDYQTTDIEVVLETLFDDDRLHLTEKSLRPIACAQPFILAGTHGSLAYLRSYGFKTFSQLWDESYDLIQDPEQRLICVTDLMKQIATWSADTRRQKLRQAQIIADHNRRHFFSTEFFHRVVDELRTNLATALNELEQTNTSRIWIERRKQIWNLPEFKESWYDFGADSYWPGRTRQDIVKVLKHARHYYNRNQ
jgi:hypothetical protein